MCLQLTGGRKTHRAGYIYMVVKDALTRSVNNTGNLQTETRAINHHSPTTQQQSSILRAGSKQPGENKYSLKLSPFGKEVDEDRPTGREGSVRKATLQRLRLRQQIRVDSPRPRRSETMGDIVLQILLRVCRPAL